MKFFDFDRIIIYVRTVIFVFDLIFGMKGDEVLERFQEIHDAYPKFLHIKFAKILLVYDPEIAKK